MIIKCINVKLKFIIIECVNVWMEYYVYYGIDATYIPVDITIMSVLGKTFLIHI